MSYFPTESVSASDFTSDRTCRVHCADCPSGKRCQRLERTVQMALRIERRHSGRGKNIRAVREFLRRVMGLGYNFPYGGYHCLLVGEDQRVERLIQQGEAAYAQVFDR